MAPAFINIGILDILDIFLVAVLLFTLYKMLKGTVAINILLGLVALFLVWKVVAALQMEMLSQILGAFISVGLVALIIIFQPEIRQFLLAVGTTNFFRRYGNKFSFLRNYFHERFEFDVDAVVAACRRMAEIKEGALIVITRENELGHFVKTGQVVDAAISTALIENIFFKNSPLHDGAMIVTNNRIKAAGCILPVTKKTVSSRAGLRHRAAIGITERSDAIAIIVSEETGKISYSTRGEIEYYITPATLQQKLIDDLGLGNSQK
ncbi:MAG: diadenylate cyclase CdaA [Bacteroidales bacterium]|nr:diadenylate cyclase CdaA [Bacteroidales bacterium]